MTGGTKEDQKKRLEQLLRETREMKAQEAQAKWTMKREEDKVKKAEKAQDEKDILVWRDEQRKHTAAYESQLKKEIRAVDVKDSREYQEHKRFAKAAHKESELEVITQDYLETKENSEWHEEVKRIADAEWPKPRIEENLEKYRLVAEYKLEEQKREDTEKREARAAAEQAEMDIALLKARQQRELALKSLECTRSRHTATIPSGHHLAARPK